MTRCRWISMWLWIELVAWPEEQRFSQIVTSSSQFGASALDVAQYRFVASEVP